MFSVKKIIFKSVIWILIFSISLSVMPIHSLAITRSIGTILSLPDERLIQKVYVFSPDKEFLKILEEFYGETETALVRMDTEKYDSFAICTFAGNLKKTLEKAQENAKTYTGDSIYLGDILDIIDDYIVLLDKILIKAKGLDPDNMGTPGFHNFDFSRENVGFTDVPEGIWYEEDVKRLASAGIFKGTGNNQFSPDAVLTKAEAMALTSRINAIYNGRLYDYEKFMEKGGENWKQAVYDYCEKYDISLCMPREFDEVCSRNDVARLILGALPKDTFTFKNSTFDIPDHSERKHFVAQETLLLFVYGICMGTGTALDGKGELTRAQAAALIYRTANPEARITLRDYLYIPDKLITKYPESYSYMKADNSQKNYKRVYQIFGTKWNEGMRDLTGNVNTLPTGNAYWSYKYGAGHIYFTANQEQYDFVTDTAIEAFAYANDPLNWKKDDYYWVVTHYNKDKKEVPAIQSYAKGEISYEEMVEIYFGKGSRGKPEEKRKRIDKVKEMFGFTSDADYFNLMRVFETVNLMWAYLGDVASKNAVPNAIEYSAKTGSGSLTHAGGGYQQNESYYYLTKGMPIDCDGESTINMLIYDTLGFSTRMMAADYVNHAIPEFYIGDRWFCVGDGKIGVQFTHEELLYDIATMNPETRDNSTTNNLYVQGAATDIHVSISPNHTGFHE